MSGESLYFGSRSHASRSQRSTLFHVVEIHEPFMEPPTGQGLAGIEVSDDFERFNQRNDLFTRAFWDPQVQSKDTDAFFASYRIEASPRRGDGVLAQGFCTAKRCLGRLGHGV